MDMVNRVQILNKAFGFHIVQILLVKEYIQLFSLKTRLFNFGIAIILEEGKLSKSTKEIDLVPHPTCSRGIK